MPSRLDRMRVRRAATSTLALPTLPKLPEALKVRLVNIRQSLEQYDSQQETWRVHAQQIIDQALNALKLDPGEDVERLRTEVRELRIKIEGIVPTDVTDIYKQIKGIIEWLHRLEDTTGRDGRSVHTYQQATEPPRAKAGDIWFVEDA